MRPSQRCSRRTVSAASASTTGRHLLWSPKLLGSHNLAPQDSPTESQEHATEVRSTAGTWGHPLLKSSCKVGSSRSHDPCRRHHQLHVVPIMSIPNIGHRQQRSFFSRKEKPTTPNDESSLLTLQEEEDFENLMYIAQKRNVQVTVQKGTQAGVAAGICVCGGILVGGPVGAVVGGAIGTLLAAKMSKRVVSLKQMLKETPRGKRRQVYRVFKEAIREELEGGFSEIPELKLLLGGGSIMSVTRYCLDRDMMEREKLERLDRVLQKVRGESKDLLE